MKRGRGLHSPKQEGRAPVSIGAGSGGEWLPVEELRGRAIKAAGAQVTIDLAGVDYLDARSLQILLALAIEQRQNGMRLNLANASAPLLRWFEYAGVASQLPLKDAPGR